MEVQQGGRKGGREDIERREDKENGGREGDRERREGGRERGQREKGGRKRKGGREGRTKWAYKRVKKRRGLTFAMSLICCTVKTVFDVCSATLVSSRMNFLACKEHTSYFRA